MANENRLVFLDALRGLAIALVMMFHAYVRWPELVSFGKQFWNNRFFPNGWVGVQLFFLISGFVILMTLDRCSSFRDFILRRWLRLFPAMLLCSLIVFFSAPLFPERPLGTPVLRDLLPGLTFVEPSWWRAIIGAPQGVIEGAFWSIFVEVKFYVIFGLLYFRLGGSAAIAVLFGLYLLAPAIILAGRLPVLQDTDLSVARAIVGGASFEFFGWFAAGALFYRYFHERRPALFAAATACALIAAVLPGFTSNVSLPATVAIALFFAASVAIRPLQRVLANPVLLTLGFASYPLYLIHENTMVAMIVKLGHAAPGIPAVALPLLPMAVLVAIAWVIARYLEPAMRERLKPWYGKAREALLA